MGIRGRRANNAPRDIRATRNYSNPFCNYSKLCWNPLGFIGREEKRTIRRVDPVFEIYYYSIAGRAEINYSNPRAHVDTQESTGGGGGLCKCLRECLAATAFVALTRGRTDGQGGRHMDARTYGSPDGRTDGQSAVSYTHLTLPTNREV